MNAIRIVVAVLFFLSPSFLYGAGLAYNENFVVLAPNQLLADAVLSKASAFRREVAIEWLNEEIPPGLGRTVIHVQLSDRDKGLFLPIDGPDRKMHKMWLQTSEDKIDSTLQHEIAHLVMSTNFPTRLPSFIDEGIASRYDDTKRKEIRSKITKWLLKRGGLPKLQSMFDEQSISTDNQTAYTAAASLTEFLLSQGDKSKLLSFAVAGRDNGWNNAIKSHYRFENVDELQVALEVWTKSQLSKELRTASSITPNIPLSISLKLVR